MLNAIERYIKQAIVDRNALVASSALIAGIHLIQNNTVALSSTVIRDAANKKTVPSCNVDISCGRVVLRNTRIE